ncbi:MAG: hypothetical protein ABIQ98_06605 [Sphingomicrobium sp.]
MSLLFLLFRLMLVAVTAFAFWRGDRDTRLAAVICCIATLASQLLLSPVARRYSGVEAGDLAVDLLTLVGFVAVALRSGRFWPLWVSGLQLITSVGHLLKAADWSLLPRAYGAATMFWSIPILLILAVGTWRSHRRKVTGLIAT